MMLTRPLMLSVLAALLWRNHATPIEEVTEAARFDDDFGLDDWDLVALELDAEEAFGVELLLEPVDDTMTVGGLLDEIIAAGFQVLPEPALADGGAS